MKVIDTNNEDEYRKRIARVLSYIEENKYPINEYNCSCSGDTTSYYEYELCCDPEILKRMLKGNDEVEILEEEKKDNFTGWKMYQNGKEVCSMDCSVEEKKIPEKLDIRQEKNIKNNWKWKVYGKEHSYNISTPQKIIADKVNEIIDYLKSKGE